MTLVPLRLFAIASALALGIGCGDGSVEPAPPNTVTITDNAFSPETLTVAVGSRVQWANTGAVIHDVWQYEGEFESDGIAPGTTFSADLTEVGLFEYACTRHSGMQGAVLVQ
jgi:plastocyanin